jgi:trimeric autotransporter adhesin
VNATRGTSAYGVWYNGGTSYTIAGGYNTLGKRGRGPVAKGFLIDYNVATGKFSNWRSFAGPQGLVGPSVATHFQGIGSPEPGVYTMSAASTDAGSNTVFEASLATVRRNRNGTFSHASWVNLNYPGAEGIESANSVAGNQVVGIATTSTGTVAYQATVDLD